MWCGRYAYVYPGNVCVCIREYQVRVACLSTSLADEGYDMPTLSVHVCSALWLLYAYYIAKVSCWLFRTFFQG